MIISLLIRLRIRNIWDKVKEKIKIDILCSITFSLKSCRFCGNVEKYGRTRQATDGNIKWRVRFVCWINKKTKTHSEYVILIAFPRQQLLRQRVSVLGCSYIVCIVKTLPTLFLSSVGVAQRLFAPTRLFHSDHMVLIRRYRNKLMWEICTFIKQYICTSQVSRFAYLYARSRNISGQSCN